LLDMARKTTHRTTMPTDTTEPANQLLTSAQLRCLKTWWRLYQENGEEPSLRQLSAELELTDNNAAPLVRQLDRKGAFEREIIEKPGPRKITPWGKKWLSMG
jgi:DNA-binding MarR family transcriptional regulator